MTMTAAPFVSSVRVRPRPIVLARPGSELMSVRVEMPDVWDAVRVEASTSTTVAELKRAALEELYPKAMADGNIVLKLRGFEVLDEQASLLDAGARDGSCFFMTFRRRRPVR
jgi:hypothetical protein